MSKLPSKAKLTFYSCIIRQRIYLHISKKNFIKHKKAFKTIIGKRRFDILQLRCEKEMSYQEIAKLYNISATRVKQIVGRSYELLKKEGYQIEEHSIKLKEIKF